jgi:hypothetical protein
MPRDTLAAVFFLAGAMTAIVQQRPDFSGVLAAAVNSTVVADENLTVGSAVWLPAESIAPGR